MLKRKSNAWVIADVKCYANPAQSDKGKKQKKVKRLDNKLNQLE